MTARQVIHVEGQRAHSNPIPHGITLGSLILPSVIGGRNPEVAATEDSPEMQIAFAFRRMEQIIKASGGALDGIGKITVYLRDMSHRDILNREWSRRFPDAENRPARHVVKADLAATYIQLDVIASQ